MLKSLLFTFVFISLLRPVIASASQCNTVFLDQSKIASKSNGEYRPPPAVSLNQVVRLKSILSNMSEPDRVHLFDVLSLKNTQELSQKIKSGESFEEVDKLVQRFPHIELVLLDLFELGNMFPGIFSVENSSVAIPKLLNRISNQSKNSNSKLNKYMTNNHSLTSALRYSINETIKNIIKNALEESQGITYNKTKWQRIVGKISIWFFPLYNKVRKRVIPILQAYQRQLDRVYTVDSIIVRQGLLKAEELKLTKEEFEELTSLVLNSPKELNDIVKDLQYIVGEKLDFNKAVPIPDINFHETYKKIKKISKMHLLRSFDKENLHSLERMQQIINQARLRLNKPAYTAKDYLTDELQIYFGAHNRGVSFFRSSYQNHTSETSNESYTVKRMRTKSVSTGRKDSKGNDIRRTKVYYVTATVRPSFETILSGRYDTGAKPFAVHGLSGIKRRAKRMVSIERRFRNSIADSQDLISKVIDTYTDVTLNSQGRVEILGEIKKDLNKAKLVLKSLHTYAESTPTKVKNNYSKDNVENFHNRNEDMLERIESSKETLLMLEELILRSEPKMLITFNTRGFEDWLGILKTHRDRNYANKAILGLTATSFGSLYFYNEQVNTTVNEWASQLPLIIENLPF